MASKSMNLSVQREGPSTLLPGPMSSWRSVQGMAGLLLVLAGGVLATRAFGPWLRSLLARWNRPTPDDTVTESSEESFPASDPPAWTPTVGAHSKPQ